jgi:predicted metal-dependent hydrolase
MSDITVRKIDFCFDDDIPFQSVPGNPRWGNFVNYISLIAPAFERYFIKATRDALPDIKDEKVRRDADLFCKQEAQHSKQHLAHLQLLTKQYPGLQETHDAIMASYDKLYQENSQDFHLAYAATVELCLGPMARFVVENRDALFAGGDSRIASFILWHFIEEFEHRNAAIDIYNAVRGSWTYRLRCVPAIGKHLEEIERITKEGLKKHVGLENVSETSGCFAPVSRSKVLKVQYDWLCTLLPYHKPDNIRTPAWVQQWHRDEQSGQDMRRYYSAAN